MAHIYTLTNALGGGTILLAASFAAYLIGAALSVDSDRPIVGLLMFRGNLFRRNSRLAIGIERFYPDYYRMASGRISQKVLGDVSARVMRLKEAAVIDNDTLKAIEQPAATEATEEWNMVAQTFYNQDQLLSPVRDPSGTPWEGCLRTGLALAAPVPRSAMARGTRWPKRCCGFIAGPHPIPAPTRPNRPSRVA
jgi:hypothetical protein